MHQNGGSPGAFPLRSLRENGSGTDKAGQIRIETAERDLLTAGEEESGFRIVPFARRKPEVLFRESGFRIGGSRDGRGKQAVAEEIFARMPIRLVEFRIFIREPLSISF